LTAAGIVGIQATTGANVSPRIAKARASPELVSWLEAGGQFEIWGWRKIGNKKRKRKTWEVRIIPFVLRDGLPDCGAEGDAEATACAET